MCVCVCVCVIYSYFEESSPGRLEIMLLSESLMDGDGVIFFMLCCRVMYIVLCMVDLLCVICILNLCVFFPSVLK